MQKQRLGVRGRLLIAAVPILVAGSGCAAQEAVIDGFFGGISDAVAAVVSNLLLSTVPGGAILD